MRDDNENVPAIASAALAAFAEAGGHTPIMDGGAVALVGPLAGYAVAWKWTNRVGLSYSVRSMTGRFILTLQHPTPAAAYAEAMAGLDAAESGK